MRRSGTGRAGMSSLEKIFLGTMALFASVILAMFSLYFDVADMFTGGLDKGTGITIGMYAQSQETARRAGVSREIMPDELGNAAFGVPGTSEGFIGFAFHPAPVDTAKKNIIAAERRRLKEKGIRSTELINLLAKGAYRWVVDRYLSEADSLVDEKDYFGALRKLEEGLVRVDRDNLIARADLLAKIVEIYYLYLKDFPTGREAVERLGRIKRRIARIRSMG